MLTNRDLVATGMLLRDPGRQPTGLLIGELTTSPTPPTGAAFPPLADWIAIAAPGGQPSNQPDAWIHRLQPCFAQLLVVLLVGLGRGPPRLGAAGRWSRGVLQPWALAGDRRSWHGSAPKPLLGGAVHDDDPQDAAWTRLRGAGGQRLRQIAASAGGGDWLFAHRHPGCQHVRGPGSARPDPHRRRRDRTAQPGRECSASVDDLGANKAVGSGPPAQRSVLICWSQAVPDSLHSRAAELAVGARTRSSPVWTRRGRACRRPIHPHPPDHTWSNGTGITLTTTATASRRERAVEHARLAAGGVPPRWVVWATGSRRNMNSMHRVGPCRAARRKPGTPVAGWDR